jgi:hypothetical protein
VIYAIYNIGLSGAPAKKMRARANASDRKYEGGEAGIVKHVKLRKV